MFKDMENRSKSIQELGVPKGEKICEEIMEGMTNTNEQEPGEGKTTTPKYTYYNTHIKDPKNRETNLKASKRIRIK